MTVKITNTDDLIDSREIIERIEELTEIEEDTEVALDIDEMSELATLRAFAEEASENCDDWAYGVLLIRYSYMKEYAQECAEECGAPAPAEWPYRCIDWDQATEEFQMDYNEVEFDGVTYFVR